MHTEGEEDSEDHVEDGDDNVEEEEEGGAAPWSTPRSPASSSSSPSLSSIPVSRSECVQCKIDSSLRKEEEGAAQQKRREERTGEFKCLSELARRWTCFAMTPLNTSLTYYVIDGFWLQQWRAYTLDNRSESLRPEDLTNESLRCEHGGVNIPQMLHDKLQSSVRQENSIEVSCHNMSKNTEDLLPGEAPVCELVTEEQWVALSSLEYFSSAQERTGGSGAGGSGASDPRAQQSRGVPGALSPRPFIVQAVPRVIYTGTGAVAGTGACTRGSATGGGDEDSVVTWEWQPEEQCLLCTASIRAQRTRHVTYYQNQNIDVVEVSFLDELPALVSASLTPGHSGGAAGGAAVTLTPTPTGTTSTIASRRGTRSCRSKSSNKHKRKIEISSDELLAHLKLKIYQNYPHACPAAQRIYHASGGLLEGLHKTLEKLGVLAGCTLYVLVEGAGAGAAGAKRKSRRSSTAASQKKKKKKGQKGKADSSDSSSSSEEGGEDGEVGSPDSDDDGGVRDDDGVMEMYEIISIHENDGYAHISSSSSSGSGGVGAGGGGGEVTDLTSSAEKSEGVKPKKRAVAEDGFSGTFLLG